MTELEKDPTATEGIDYKSEDPHDREKLLGLSDLTTGQLKAVEKSATERAKNALILDESDENYKRIADKDMAQKMAERDNKRITELEERLASEEEPTTKFGKIMDVISGRKSLREAYGKRIEEIKKGTPSEYELTSDVAINSTEMAMEEKGINTDRDESNDEDGVRMNDIAVKARHAVLDEVEPDGDKTKYDRYDKKTYEKRIF